MKEDVEKSKNDKMAKNVLIFNVVCFVITIICLLIVIFFK